MIIDGHAHLIEHFAGMGARGEVRGIGGGKVQYIGGEEEQIIPAGLGEYGFLAETLIRLMDEAHIDKAILLHGIKYGLQNAYVYEAVQKYPRRFKGSGSFDPCIEGAEKTLEILTVQYGFDVLKFEMSSGAGLTGLHPTLKLNGEELDRVYQAARARDLTLVFDIGARGMRSFQVKELIDAAARYPDVRFVLCHLLAADGSDYEKWREDIEKLARQENIWFDLTAIPWNLKEAYPYPQSIRYVKTARDIVGASRLLWGSDVPNLLMLDDYEHLYEYLAKSGEFSEKELDDIYYKTAQTVYRC